MADRILTTDEFVEWHDNYANFRNAGFDKVNAVYEIFKKNGLDDNIDVNICYDSLSDEDKLEVSRIVMEESLNEAKKDEWEVKLIFKDGRTKIGLITDNSEEASKFAKDQYKNNKEVKDFKVFHNGEETPFDGAYYDHGGYYQDHVGGYGLLGEDIEENNSIEEAVEIHDQLNPKIWTEDKELRPEVRAKVLQIVDKFKSQLLVDNVDLKIEDIYILGSNANYNYTEESDLDVHIIADESFDCSAEHLPLLYNCYKALFNSKYDIRIKGINVELYVENKDKLSNVSAGIYSLNQGWIRNPAEYEIPEFDQLAVDRGVQEWEDRYYAITENPSLKKIDDYINELYELRKSTIQNGEFAEGNLIFKEIRRLGYLDDLKELKVDLTSQELSLESFDAQKQINEEEQSFGDFIADMLTKDKFIMLSNYCKNYFYKIIGKGLGAYRKENFKYYKQRLLKKLAAINMLSEEDKTLSWEDLNLKYLYAPNLIKEIKKNNLKPYQVFLALLEAENMPTNLIPSLNDLQDKKENYNRNNGYEINEANTKLRYHYRGPVYHFEHLLSDDWEAYTEAVSDAQALNNLKAKAKNYFGYILQTRITLNPDYLELVTGEEDIPDEKFKPVKKCEKCGHQLNDAGECPVCDLGDESAIREELEVFATYWTVTKKWLIMGGDMSDKKEYNFKTKEEAEEFKRRAEEKEKASGMDKNWFEGPEEREIKVNFSSVDSALKEDKLQEAFDKLTEEQKTKLQELLKDLD